MTTDDPRVAWAMRANDLMEQAREIRDLRARNTGPRELPEPMPENYGLCVGEAAVFAQLATVSEATATGVYATLVRRDREQRAAEADFERSTKESNSTTTQPNREEPNE